VAGNATGLVTWACAAAFGLTALVTASTVGFIVLKVIGAIYLGWLGVHALTHRRGGLPGEAAPRRSSRLTAYRSGLLTSITNPKPAALYMALLPQFMPPPATVMDVFELAAVHIVLSATWYVLIVVGVLRARRLFEHPVGQRWLDRLIGSVFTALPCASWSRRVDRYGVTANPLNSTRPRLPGECEVANMPTSSVGCVPGTVALPATVQFCPSVE
jgi:threonine/homoserine/homoserine lactone efflux protein